MMRYFLFIVCSSLSVNLFAQNVGIGTNTPNSSALLDLSDTTKGILIPRMTEVQRLAIQNPAVGLMVYQTNNAMGLWIFDGTEWAPFMKLPSGGAIGKVLTYCSQGLIWTTDGVCPGFITSLNCADAEIPILLAGSSIPSNLFLIPYNGGDGGLVSYGSFLSTGVTGLTLFIGPNTLALLNSVTGGISQTGNLAIGNGNVFATIVGTPSGAGTANFALTFVGQTCDLSVPIYENAAVSSLNCENKKDKGTLTLGTEVVSGVTTRIPYTGGNGGYYPDLGVASNGVSGLSANLQPGFLAQGDDSLTINISGNPSSSGIASFELNLFGQSCTITRTVNAPDPLTNHTCGVPLVHNPSLTYGTMTDQDGHTYKTIQIGTQEWMAENLRTTKYRGGQSIDSIYELLPWLENTTGAYTSANFITDKDCPKGKLYNWYAITNSNEICPVGWHVPTDDDWRTLLNFIDVNSGGGTLENVAANKMKTSSPIYWGNTLGTNETGFSAIPGAYLGAEIEGFEGDDFSATFWSASAFTEESGSKVLLTAGDTSAFIVESNKKNGLSVRCVKD